MNKIAEYLRLMRIKHYLKNFLIFVPLLFSGQFFDKSKLLICILGFISFGLLDCNFFGANFP